MRLGIVGAGGHGKVLLDIILEISGLTPVGFFDRRTEGKAPYDYPVLGNEDDLLANWHTYDIDRIIVAIGDNRSRKRIYQKMIAAGIPTITLVHPHSFVSRFASLGAGTVVCAHAFIGPGSKIGNNCIINTGASIDHDCLIEDDVHICPGSTLAGTVSIGERTMLGTGTIIIPGVRVGTGVIAGAGSVIIRDVPDNLMVAGVPTKVIRDLEEK